MAEVFIVVYNKIMADELTYRIAVLRLITDTLKRIRADPQTPRATVRMLNDLFKDGSSIFPILIVGPPEMIKRQILLLRQSAEICNDVLGDIWRDPLTPHSARAVITHALTQFGYVAKHYRKWGPSPYAHGQSEICTPKKSISPPRRPPLQVYQAGDPRPRQIMVFRR